VSVPRGKTQEAGAFALAQAAEVRAVLGRKQMTMRELSDRAGLSTSYLSKRLRGDAPMTLNDLDAICKALDEDIMEFIASAVEAAKRKPHESE
jgi:transcriptional regulator with XRE-family HTH domain